MGNTMEKHATLVAEGRSVVSGRYPAVLHLGTIGIKVCVCARTLKDHKFAAFLMYIKAAFCEAVANRITISPKYV